MNACYDRLRARARRADTPLDEVATLVDARDGYDQAAMAAAVEAALRDMSPRYRAALILHDVQGLNRRELSEAMNVTWGTAGVLLFRARAAFKKRVSALLPAGGGVAALALLPALPVPSALQAPPFGAPAATAAPLAAPLAATPLAATPAALPAAAPLLGLANIGGVLGTKVALVAAGVLAMASGLAIQDVVDQNGVLSRGPATAALVQSAATQGDGADGKAFHAHWPGEVPQHLQQLQDGSTGDSSPSSPGSTSGSTGTAVRVNDGTASAGTDSSTTSTQQSGTVEPGDEPSGTTSGDSGPTGIDGDAKATSDDVKTGSSTDPAVRPR
jgi:hypothetical protein